MSYAKAMDAGVTLLSHQRALLDNLMLRTDAVSIFTTHRSDHASVLGVIAQEQINIATGSPHLARSAVFMGNIFFILSAPVAAAVAAARDNNNLLHEALYQREKRITAQGAKVTVKSLQKRRAKERRAYAQASQGALA